MEQELITAVEAIKKAILQSQYQAANETTRVQLILYYGIGRYLSLKKGKKTWGTSVLESISSQLRKELPRLRGFSATILKKMRLFYENWSFLEDSNSSVMTDELPDTKTNSSDASDELTSIFPIADFKLSGINLADFPVAVTFDQIREKGYVLSAGQYFDIKIEYVDITEDEFNAQMKTDTEELKAMFKESHDLESEIEKQLAGLKFV